MSNDKNPIIKAVILVGGPTNATRFRPLSFHVPKPLFHVGGREMIYHHCEALSLFGDQLDTIYLLGSFEETTFHNFIDKTSKLLGVKIEYDFQLYIINLLIINNLIIKDI